MENSFDFGELLKKHQKHKKKPAQFLSVSSGIQKRLETNTKERRNTRHLIFDKIRSIAKCESPAPLTEAQKKAEHRRQQLEKWKSEKEAKKKEQAVQKKKPFVVGVARIPPLPQPSVSGRVTRSQTKKNDQQAKTKERSPIKPTHKQRTQSFAPKNAAFKPAIKNIEKLPTLAPTNKYPPKKTKPSLVTFEPVLPNTTKTAQSRFRLTRQNATVSEITYKKPVQSRTINAASKYSQKSEATNTVSTSSSDVEPSKIIKRIKTPAKPKSSKNTTIAQCSSSSSDVEPTKVTKRIKTPAKPKSSRYTTIIQCSSSSSDVEPTKVTKRIKMPAREKASKNASITQSSSSSTVIEPTKATKKIKTPAKTKSSKTATDLTKTASTFLTEQSDSNLSSPKNKKISDVYISSTDKKATVVSKTRLSKAANYSFTSGSSATNVSTDVEFIEDRSPVKNLLYTPKNPIPKSESGSEERLRSPKSPIELSLTPEQMESAKMSPCVTMSRGKDNARKEMMWKMEEGYLDDDASDADSIEHFRKQLSSEVNRLTEMADTWDKVLAQTILPDPIQEAILSAVGQTRLLMSQKLSQFRGLLERAARPALGTTVVTPADLHGFWDMVFMQVENVDLKFKKLEELRARDWAEEAPPPRKRAGTRPDPARPIGPTRTTVATGVNKAPSRLRDVIAAARKAQKDSEMKTTCPPENEITFEAGFFSVRSPVRSPRPPASPRPLATPPRPTLLKHVLSNEAKKASSKKSTPFAMLHASILAKTAELEGISPLPTTPEVTIPLATPGRSILKSAHNNSTKADRKSCKVLFDHSDTEISEHTGEYLIPMKPLEVGSKQETSKSKSEDKENVVGVMTRSQRKSLNASEVLKSPEMIEPVKTPRRSSSRRKKDVKSSGKSKKA